MQILRPAQVEEPAIPGLPSGVITRADRGGHARRVHARAPPACGGHRAAARPERAAPQTAAGRLLRVGQTQR